MTSVCTRWIEMAALLGLAWCVAVPVSRWFAAQRWTAIDPLGSLLVWQAIGVVGGLAMLTGELTLAASNVRGSWLNATATSLLHPFSGGVARAIGLVLFVLSALWLLAVLGHSFVRARRSRAEHRMLLELLSVPATYDGAALDVLDSATPTAYSLPRARPRGAAHIVVSSATRDQLEPPALQAVIAHERAHIRQRHTLLVQPFISWERSLAPLDTPKLARRRVEELIEIACDDAARRATGSDALRSAVRFIVPAGPCRDEREHHLTQHGPAASLRLVLVVAAATLVLGPPLALVLLG